MVDCKVQLMKMAKSHEKKKGRKWKKKQRKQGELQKQTHL
jgi:hypothetical protein